MSSKGEGFGVGIVGAGNIAAAHVDAVTKTVGAELVGVASRGAARAAALGAKHGVKAFATVAELVADPAVDIVAVCTPSGAHLEPALAAIAAGKHVIVEKPLEISTARALELVNAAERAGVALATIFMSRFADANVFLRASARGGRLGRLVQGNAYVPWYRDQAYYDSGAWRGTKALDGGGALMNQAIHQLDLLLWVMGPVAEVSAYAGTLAHERIEVEDTLVASLRFESGALGQLSAATSMWPGRPKTLEVYGTDGLAVVSDDVLVEWHNRNDAAGERDRVLAEYGGQATGGSSDPMAISFENHRRQYQEFVDSLSAGRPSSLGGREGVKAVAVIEAVYRAAATGRPATPESIA